jgi:diguanylate cyclase (GGDEF)-like protein
MASTDSKVTSIVTRVALLVALAVTLALPLGYWFIAYRDLSGELEFKARVKATALSGLIASLPELWMYADNRLQGLLAREPVPLETEAVQVYDEHGKLLAQAGTLPALPVLRRSYPLYDAARVAGRVEVSDSLRRTMYGTAIAGALGILLGGSVFVALRTLPLGALRRVTERLNYLAYYDLLTGLANRALFLQRLQQSVLAAAGAQRKFAVSIVDIERFKTINDGFGRQTGDRLLQQIAERFKSAGVDPARMARLGADHFAVATAEVQNEEAMARLTEESLSRLFDPLFRIGGLDLRISARVGIAMFPSDGKEAETLLRNAEAALEKAKVKGERYLFFTQEMTERIHEKLSLESKLRRALEKEEFVLHYQPKVDLEQRRIMGVEALIHWRSPELGLVPPLRFIPLLEETGLILQVGSWALKRASLDHRRWAEAGLTAPRIAVNVSPIQLRQRDFVAVVEQAISGGLAPTCIDLEITESLIMEDVQGNIEKLKAVRRLGVNIAIDDFGTGYSSLAYLAKLPVDTLKIDRSFILTMLNDAAGMTLVRTMISLAHSLRLKVVAEGVDAEEQAKVLRLLGCEQMQGDLFSKPLPLAQITAMLPKILIAAA